MNNILNVMLPSVASAPSALAVSAIGRNARAQSGTAYLVTPLPEPRKRIDAWDKSVLTTDAQCIPMVEAAYTSALEHTGIGGAVFGHRRTETRLRERPAIC